jgi:tetratricopeptide (TPR) repeat protein
MERDLRGVRRLLEGKDFGSMEEINTYLRELTAEGKLPEGAPQTALERAQEMAYQAMEAKGKKERVRLAIEAINVCKDCADAYVLLAEEEAETPEGALDRYRQGVEAGERALGPDAFTEDVGHFWGLVETRPYMRAREGLADCLLATGEWDAAIEHYRDMLRLNPNDNQGIRYRLLAGLLGSGDIDGAEELLDQFKDEATAAWLFTGTLVSFIRRGDTPNARRRLREAMKHNPHVALYLLGERRMPRVLPEMIGLGDRDEAVMYVAQFAGGWLDVPGATEWLRTVSRGK